jgi:hypothetical protein
MDEAIGVHHGLVIGRAAPFSDGLRAAPSSTVSRGEGMGKQRSPGAGLPAAVLAGRWLYEVWRRGLAAADRWISSWMLIARVGGRVKVGAASLC